jgi:hypothetical protein
MRGRAGGGGGAMAGARAERFPEAPSQRTSLFGPSASGT